MQQKGKLKPGIVDDWEMGAWAIEWDGTDGVGDGDGDGDGGGDGE